MSHSAHFDQLAASYRRRLDRQMVDSASLPDDVVVPTLFEAYVAPKCSITQARHSRNRASHRVEEDASAAVVAHLEQESAYTAPLVVLGQPGTGKSALTHILAARLGEQGFVAVRVELRAMPAEGTYIQEFIERAVYLAIGESVSWPELRRSAGHLRSVVILDGLDELLWANRADRADFLEEVAAFQQRERELGRPLAVMVTMRSGVADRVRYPADCVVMQLEAFDVARIGAWLGFWDRANSVLFARRGSGELTTDMVNPYGELASQPLLLLMLALYDAGGDVLRHSAATTDRALLYDRLLRDFALREVRKNASSRAFEREESAAEDDLQGLGVMALGMFNRYRDWATEAELDADLTALLADVSPVPTRQHPGLATAGKLAPQFFFVFETQTTHGEGQAERKYEFLHASLGEFLVARLIIRAVLAAADGRGISPGRVTGHEPAEAFLRAVLSFAVLSSRAPIIEFCSGLIAQAPEDIRRRSAELLLGLLREALEVGASEHFAQYEPSSDHVIRKSAAYSANLVLLVVLALNEPVDARAMFGDQSAVATWRSHALLWESQLSAGDWRSLWETLRVVAEFEDVRDDEDRLESEYWYGEKTVAVRREDGSPLSLWTAIPNFRDQFHAFTERVTLDKSLFTDLSMAAGTARGRALREAAFRCDAGWISDLLYAVLPTWNELGEVSMVTVDDNFARGPMLRVLMELWSTSATAASSERRARLYHLALRGGRSAEDHFRYPYRIWSAFLRQLALDAEVMEPELVAGVLLEGVGVRLQDSFNYHFGYVEVLTVLARRADADQRTISKLFHPFRHDDLDSTDAEFMSYLAEARGPVLENSLDRTVKES